MRVKRIALSAMLVLGLVVVGLGNAPSYEAGNDAEVDRIRQQHRFVDSLLSHTPDSVEAYQRGFEETLAFLQHGLDQDFAKAAAERVYRVIDLSARLPQRSEILHVLADSAYHYVPRDTSTGSRMLFLLALATAELNRGDLQTTIILTDSIIQVGRPLVPIDPFASAHLMKGYALEGSNRPEEALAAFETAVALYRTLPENGLLSAASAAARAALSLKKYARALELSDEVLALMSARVEAGIHSTEDYSLWANHGLALAGVGRSEEALAAGHKSVALASQRRDPVRVTKAKILFGQIATLCGAYELAAKQLRAGLQASSLTGSNADRDRLDALTNLSKLEELRRNFEQAMHYQRQAYALRDSIRASSHSWRLETLKDIHARERMRQQLALAQARSDALSAEASEHKTYLIASAWSLFAGGLVVVLLVGRLRTRKKVTALLEQKVEQRTKELHARAEELERSNAELERFAYIASHDLKTPLRNVTSFLNLIDRRLKGPARKDVEEYIEIAIGYAKQMHALIAGVLEYNQVDGGAATPSEPIELAVLCKGIERDLRATIAACGGLITFQGQATVVAPREYVRQMITKLIRNGLTYNESAIPTVEVSLFETKEQGVCVRVSDNGIGIDASFHEQVFGLFKRLHTMDEYQGTGLGLAMCKKLATRLGGSLCLESSLGRGSVFTLTLPSTPKANSRVSAQVLQQVATR